MNESIVKKFHGVPQHVKAAISRPEVLEKLERLEDTYNVSLAETLIRLAAKDLRLDTLPGHLTAAFSLSPNETKELAASLTKDILTPILPYLNEPAAPMQPSGQRPVQPPVPSQPSARAPEQPRRVQDVAPRRVPQPVFSREVGQPPSQTLEPVPAAPKQARTAPPPPKLPVEVAPFVPPAVEQPKIAPTPPVPRLSSPPRNVPSTPVPSPVSGPKPLPPPPNRPSGIPSQPTTRKSVASYAVSPEDEQDIVKHRDRLAEMGGVSPTADLERVIADLVDKRALTFATPVLEKRFVTAMLSRLRDVRTSVALQELLERSEKIGGLGFSPSLVHSVIEDVDGLARQLHEKGVLPPPSIKSKPRPSVPAVAPAPMKTVPVSPLPFSSVPTVDAKVPVPSATPIASPHPTPPPPRRPPAPPIPAAPASPEAPKAPFVERPQLRRRPAATEQHGRPMMADVTVPRQKPMGPVDELGALTVREFRALAPDPREAANKILEKIDLLTEESYPLRAESVKAWRTSPLFRLYVELGQESLAREKTIEEVLAARQGSSAPSLSLQEFAIIADINKRLIP